MLAQNMCTNGGVPFFPSISDSCIIYLTTPSLAYPV